MRTKPSTNEFYRAVLDNALREQWSAPKPDAQRAKQERSRRLSSLYGYNMASAVIKERMGKPSRGRDKSRPSSTADRSMTPYKSVQSLAESQSEGQLPRPSIGLLENPSDELDALIQSEHGTKSVPRRSSVASAGNSGQCRGDSSDEEEEFISDQRERRTQKRESYKEALKKIMGSEAAEPKPEQQQADIHKHPWYFGYQNAANMPPDTDCSLRYGHSGVLNMIRIEKGIDSRSLVDYGITNLTLRHSMPKYLGEEKMIDEYVPKIGGPPRNWDIQASYVTGSKLKPKVDAPAVPGCFKKQLERVSVEVQTMTKHLRTEHREEALEKASRQYRTVEISLETGRPKVEKNKLIKEGRRMKYLSGSTAMCFYEEKELEISKTLEKERESRIKMRELKWTESFYLYKLLRSLSIQLKPSLEEFLTLLNDLRGSLNNPTSQAVIEEMTNVEGMMDPSPEDIHQDVSIIHPSRTSLTNAAAGFGVHPSPLPVQGNDDQTNEVYISRETFVNLLCGHFEHADRRRMNKLYSSFDPLRFDQVDYRLVMVAQRCFWKLGEPAVEKVRSLLKLMDFHRKSGILSMEEVEAVFTVCSVYEEEEERIQMHLRDARPFFVSHTILSEPGHIHLDEFDRMLTMYGRPEHHPLVVEFITQMKQRLQFFLLSSSQESNSSQTNSADPELL